MKKLILVALILFIKVSATNAQQVNTALVEREDLLVKNVVRFDPLPASVKNKDYYMQKSRNNKTAAFCLMGGGAVILGIGALTFPKDYDILFENSSEKESKADAATALIAVGAAVMLSSIPFTVMSGVYKRKAKLMIDSRNTGFAVPPGVSHSITSLTLEIPIGK